MTALRGGLAFSHLFFADDLVLFDKVNHISCLAITEVLDFFALDLDRRSVSQNQRSTSLQMWIEIHEKP